MMMSRAHFLKVVQNSWKTVYFRAAERQFGGIAQNELFNFQKSVIPVPRNGCQCVAINSFLLTKTPRRFSDKAETKNPIEAAKKDMAEAKEEEEFHPRATTPRWIDKKVLVWMGRYSSEDAIPTLVSDAVINTARDKFRVYVSSSLIVLGFIGALITMFYGRWSSKRGNNIYERTKNNPHYKTQGVPIPVQPQVPADK